MPGDTNGTRPGQWKAEQLPQRLGITMEKFHGTAGFTMDEAITVELEHIRQQYRNLSDMAHMR
ncbi:MAG TPA: hypothetical protein VKV37_12595 [Ktedonobacteraceae bacterium]|jgi:hypothetical protein|nr:hypothetical protein [Ktedonobacteraceae bacterium]